MDHEWYLPEVKKPESGQPVICIVSGHYKDEHTDVTFYNAYLIADYFEDEGFILDGYELWADAKIDAWTPLPKRPSWANRGDSNAK